MTLNSPEELAQINDVDTVIDVGVCEGTPQLYNSFPKAKLYLIDPLVESMELTKPMLVARDYKFFSCAVGDTRGSADIEIQAKIRESSFLKRAISPGAVKEIRKVPMETLDNLMPQMDLGNTILKIDTEGYELRVLQGANILLKKCKYVICETNVKKRFKDSYTFEEMIMFMVKNKFKVRAIVHAPKLLGTIDILFERVSK